MRRKRPSSKAKPVLSEKRDLRPQHHLDRDELERRRRETDLRNAWLAQSRLTNPYLRTPEWVRQSQSPVDLYRGVQLQAAISGQQTPFTFTQAAFLTIGHLEVNPETGEITPESRVRERAHEYREASQPCESAKESRRAAILASGYGGRNGATKYKPHSEC